MRNWVVRGLVVVAMVAGALVAGVDPATAQVEEPAITVSPSTGLVDGQMVEVTGTDFDPGATIFVGACPPGVTDPFSCDATNFVAVSVDPSGGFSVDFRVYRFLETSSGPLDCVGVACTIGATDLGAVSVTAGIDFAAAPDPVLSLDVSPDTGLGDGDTVQVTGSGFSPFTSVTLRTCPAAVDPELCTHGGAGTSASDAEGDGSLDTGFGVSRWVPDPTNEGAAYDCASGACAVVAESRTGTIATPISFAPSTATLELAPSTDLADGQVVRVTGSGHPPSTDLVLATCLAGSFGLFDGCHVENSRLVTTSSTGTFAADHVVDRSIGDEDCLATACAVIAFSSAVVARADVTFATPQLSIDIEDLATLPAGTNDAVAQALISCDVATPVSLVGSISQPGISSEYVLADQSCTPSEPLRAFVPARSIDSDGTDYALGDATVEVTAWPTRSVPEAGSPPAAVVHSETVQLLDFDEVKAVIDLALADPANEELRAVVLRAIQLRVQQDPVFRAEFGALLS